MSEQSAIPKQSTTLRLAHYWIRSSGRAPSVEGQRRRLRSVKCSTSLESTSNPATETMAPTALIVAVATNFTGKVSLPLQIHLFTAFARFLVIPLADTLRLIHLRHMNHARQIESRILVPKLTLSRPALCTQIFQ